MYGVINSLKTEYLEKQKKAFNEIQKKRKYLRELDANEREKLKEIMTKIQRLSENKQRIVDRYSDLNERQIYLAKKYYYIERYEP